MESTRSKGLIEGFDADFKSIVNEFKDSSLDLKLQDFLKVWDAKRLDLLFANRFDPRELIESIREINHYLVDKLIDTNSQDDLSRKVALYFLLCQFVKQPESLRRKIRMRCEDALYLETKCTNDWQQDDDIGFAWRYLRFVDAIDFVEERVFYGPSMLTSRKWRKVAEQEKSKLNLGEEEKRDTYEFLESKIEPDLQEIESYLSQYDYLKSQLNIESDTISKIESEAMGSVEVEAPTSSGSSVKECLTQARDLLSEYMATQP